MRTSLLRIISGLVGTFAFAGYAPAAGLMPEPTLHGVTIEARTAFDATKGMYRYEYTLGNPATNTGAIWYFKVDISQPVQYAAPSVPDGLTLPSGNTRRTFGEALGELQPLLPTGSTVAPIGQDAPPGWNGGFGRDGYAGFAKGSNGQTIAPGTGMSGFALFSPRVPTLREIQAKADWVLIVPDHDEVDDETLAEAGRVEQRITFTATSLGPSPISGEGSFEHWNRLRDDLERAVSLGWFHDAVLATTIRQQLADARVALDAGDGTLAKSKLQALLAALNSVGTTHCRREALDLLTLNINSLVAHTWDTPVRIEPVYSLTPTTARHALGEEHIVIGSVLNAADQNKPLSGYVLQINVIDGPHAGESAVGHTDANGEVVLSYRGTHPGTDHIVLTEMVAFNGTPVMVASAGILRDVFAGGEYLAEATVTWEGGPDLAVPFFMPPILKSKGGNVIYVTDATINMGTLPAPESITRYYLASTLPITPENARVIGERPVPALPVDGESHAIEQQFRLPADLPEGLYHLAACADAPQSIAELDEDNNCSYSRLDTHISSIVYIEQSLNLPPDCSRAYPSVSLLWPPNHKLVDVSINGITYPENLPTTVTITRVQQDEPVNGLGDGDSSPDAFGVGAAYVQLRAERSGTGNGRVYIVDFSATDADGDRCNGTVTVGVPHDQGGKKPPIDDGIRYDSTQM